MQSAAPQPHFASAPSAPTFCFRTMAAMGVRLFLSVVGAWALDTKRLCNAPYPLIWDNDGNYDDALAFLYLAKSSNFELRAVTLEATGMATPHGGPPNMAALARLLKVRAPIAYGEPQSLSPVATMPLQWRIELDGFFEKMHKQGILEPSEDLISHFSAPDLIIKVLKSSSCPVVVLTTGPVTNLAKALERDPTVAENIHSVFMMGSAYGVADSNNVYDWQMNFNGVKGSCAEDGGQTYTGLSPPLDMNGQKSLVRAGCRGVNMSKHGNTEWNLFMDARAWHMVYGFLSRAKLTVLAATRWPLGCFVFTLMGFKRTFCRNVFERVSRAQKRPTPRWSCPFTLRRWRNMQPSFTAHSCVPS